MSTLSPPRILPTGPVETLADHRSRDGGRAIALARSIGPEAVIAAIEASGLRGRGGAGFPTGTKWRTVAANASRSMASTVVVNAAEGEPATFKDRTLLLADPYSVIEGAIIAALAVGADTAVIATKATFGDVVDRLTAALAEIGEAGWSHDVELGLVAGPDRYLFGEETALLQVIGGRPPLPRIAPPYREGSESTAEPAANVLAGASDATDAPPTLVNNVETLANIGPILRNGADWFRSVGTDDTPGTLLVTVVGATTRHGVAEFTAGTPLMDAIDEIGGGPLSERTITGAMSGVANPALFGPDLSTALSHDAMTQAGSGLGAAGFTVFDDETDMVAVAHGISRFLAVESCGQCVPCKADGGAIAASLDALRRSDGTPEDLVVVDERLETVTDGARCYLAQQHHDTIESLRHAAPEIFSLHADGAVPGADQVVVAPVLDIVDGQARLDVDHLEVSADWTTGADSGTSPVDRVDVAAQAE